MEFFYRTIKRELIQYVHHESPEQAQKEIFKYIIILNKTHTSSSIVF
jgi:putative transposase